MSTQPPFPKDLIQDIRLKPQLQADPVLRGAKEIYYAQFLGNGDSSGLTFNCPPKTPYSEIDRHMQIVVPVRITITIPTGVPPAEYIMDNDRCNFRSYPIHKALESMTMSINNQSFSVRLGPFVAGIEHYNTSRRLKLLNYSKTPTYGCCQCQNFHDLDSGTRSELTFFANSLAGIAPQNFPFTVVSNTNTGTGSATAVIDALFIESIWLSPLQCGEWFDDEQAFKGIRNLSFNFKFLPNAGNRMLAVDSYYLNSIPGSAATPTTTMQIGFSGAEATPFSYADLKPKLLINFLEPQCGKPSIEPNYLRQFEFQHYTKSHTTTLAAAAQLELATDYIKLNARPRKFYIFVQRPLSDFTDSPYHPDVFFGIESLEIEWNGVTIFAGAHMAQIYDICVKNGLQLEYATWRGLGYNNGIAGGSGYATSANQFASTGTVICLDVMDMGLSEQFTSTKTTQFTIRVKVTTKNIAKVAQTPVLNLVVLTDYMIKMEKQNIETKIHPAVTFFNEATDCKFEPNGPLTLKLQADRKGDWKEQRNFIKPGDVYPF